MCSSSGGWHIRSEPHRHCTMVSQASIHSQFPFEHSHFQCMVKREVRCLGTLLDPQAIALSNRSGYASCCTCACHRVGHASRNDRFPCVGTRVCASGLLHTGLIQFRGSIHTKHLEKLDVRKYFFPGWFCSQMLRFDIVLTD